MYYCACELQTIYPSLEYYIVYENGYRATGLYWVEKINDIQGIKRVSVWRREYED